MNAASADKVSATPAQIAKPERTHSIRNGLLCALAIAAAVLISNPFADMPFMDDFSYIKTAVEFARTGHIVYNGWATAMLGWQVPWGALFIKLFGFSFTGMRFAMLPLAMLAVFLFHQILRRFGVNAQNSVLGALTMGLSPVFLPMATSFMTDVPGLLVILVCIYMCQRAVAANSDHSAVAWLCAATAVNVAGGTVRQIAWLGALVMVPSTAWLLRQRRGIKAAGVLLFLISFFGVLACLHWFNRQPYSVPEHVLLGPVSVKMIGHLFAQYVKTLLCLLVLIVPVSLILLRGGINRPTWIRVCGATAAAALVGLALYRKGMVDGWMMPWLSPLLPEQWNMLSKMSGASTLTILFWIRASISLLVIFPIVILIEELAALLSAERSSLRRRFARWKNIFWILGPFALGYLLLLAPRGTYSMIQDRYVLGLVPIAIVLILSLGGTSPDTRSKVPLVSFSALILIAAISVAGIHDLYSGSRALATEIEVAKDAGLPDTHIQASLTNLGWARDGWIQISGGGHMNYPAIQTPPGAYNPNTPNLNLPLECTSWFGKVTPAIRPTYFVVSFLRPCFGMTKFPLLLYTTWLPPFHRTLYVQRLKQVGK